MVVAVAHLRGVDDRREERGESDDAGGEREAELGGARERKPSAGLAGLLESRAVVGARHACLIVAAGPAVDVVDQHVMAPLPRGPSERDELQEEEEKAECEQ